MLEPLETPTTSAPASTNWYIGGVTFLKNHRVFQSGDRIDFVPGLNVLVGDQGSGKSTLLATLRTLSKRNGEKHARVDLTVDGMAAAKRGGVGVFALDYEKDNLRTLAYLREGAERAQLSAMYASHGEMNRNIAREIGERTNAFILLDEPDTALSIRSLLLLNEAMQRAASNGCQLVVAVHSETLIRLQPQVYSLEHRKAMTGLEFIATQMEKRDGEMRSTDN